MTTTGTMPLNLPRIAKEAQRGGLARLKPDGSGLDIDRARMLRYMLYHITLGLGLKYVPYASTTFAVLLGLYVIRVVFADHNASKKLLLIGYVAGAEVLIRMTKASVPWMYSEYLMILLAVSAAISSGRDRRAMYSALLYVAFMLPSSLLLLQVVTDGEVLRQALVFNLLGPIALGAGVYAYSSRSIHREVFHDALFISMLPVISIMAIVSIAHLTGSVTYMAVSESNKAASGGYAPNQVSNILSFGAVAGVTLTIRQNRYSSLKRLLWIVAGVMLLLAMLTFSRGGVYNFLGFSAILLLQQMRASRYRFRIGLGAVFVVYAYLAYIEPAMEDYTEGALKRRYDDSKLTHREELVRDEYKIFIEHVVFGVGPGMTPLFREGAYGTFKGGVLVHTEYTRLLAEHGLFGVASLLTLMFLFAAIYIRVRDNVDRGWVLASIVWILLMFSHSATRIGIFAFLTILMVVLAFIKDDSIASQIS